MLSELDVVVFLKSRDDLPRTAERVFGALGSAFEPASSEDLGEYYEGSGLGFVGALYPNAGDLQDLEFATYQYALEITSLFWDVELDTLDLEGPLSEYYARELAFELDLETATQILLETTEEVERFKVLAYRRNSQYRPDQPPTAQKVVLVEERDLEVPFEEEEWIEEDYGVDEEDV